MINLKLSNSGIISIDTQDIKEDFEQAYKNAFGNIDVSPSSPIGQLIINDTLTLRSAIEECIKVMNNSSLYYAKGDMLDSVAQNWGQFRKTEIPQMVIAKIQGKENTKIPKNTIALSGETQYFLQNDCIIPSSGVCFATFISNEKGICKKGTLNTFSPEISSVSIINESDGSPFIEREKDNEFRTRILRGFLSIRASSTLDSILDNILSLKNVVDAKIFENETDNPVSLEDLILIPHSILVIVEGGEDIKIAEVLAHKKSLGVSTVGNTNIIYNSNNYTFSYKIYRPKIVKIKLKVFYSKNKNSPANIEDLILNSLNEYLQTVSFKIGQTIKGIEFFKAFELFKIADVLDIKVSNKTDFSDFIKLSPLEFPIIESLEVKDV